MKTEYQILQELTRLENLNVNPEVDYLTRISALKWVLDAGEVGNVAEAGASAERINSVVRLLPCPFCGRQPKEYWDYKSPESEIYNEGYNITCCVVHITAIFKDEAIEHWNTRQ